MTRIDFRELALGLRHARPLMMPNDYPAGQTPVEVGAAYDTWVECVDQVALACSADRNARFKRGKFLEACGYYDDGEGESDARIKVTGFDLMSREVYGQKS